MANDRPPYQPPRYISERPRLPGADFLVDWYLARQRDFTQRTRGENPAKWRASSLGNCPRATVLARMGIGGPRVYDAKTIRTFAWGDAIHDYVRAMFWDLGLVVDEEPYLSDALREVGGSVDLIWTPAGGHREQPTPIGAAKERLWVLQELRPDTRVMLSKLYGEFDFGGETINDIPDTLIGMELKSIHSTSLTYIFSEGPQEGHRMQAGIYKHMRLTTPETAEDVVAKGYSLRDVDRWFITYVGKDSQGMLSFEVEDSWVDLALERVDFLNRHFDAGTLPPCMCPMMYGGKGPQYCDYQEGKSCCGRDLRGQVAKQLRQLARKGR